MAQMFINVLLARADDSFETWCVTNRLADKRGIDAIMD